MRKLILISIFFFLSAYYTKAQMIKGNDTLYLNYFIATGEFGGINEGLIIYGQSNELKVKSVKYDSSSYGITLEVDTIINFYEKNKDSYTIIKAEWTDTKNKSRQNLSFVGIKFYASCRDH